VAGTAEVFVRLQDLVSGLAVAGLELAIVVTVASLLYALVARGLERAAEVRGGGLAASSRRLVRRARHALIVACVLLGIAVLAFNVSLVARGLDAWTYTLSLLQAVGAHTWSRAAAALAQLAGAAFAFFIAVRLLRRGLRALKSILGRQELLRSHDKALDAAFVGVDHLIVTSGGLLLVLYALYLFALPPPIVAGFLVIGRAYLIVAAGLLLIRSSDVIVAVLDSATRRYLQTRDTRGYYDHLHSLLPTARACLEYALWIAVGSLALAQLGWIQGLSTWTPRLIQAIGLFFLGRVVIELGHLEIARRMLPPEGLDGMARRRRETMAPIVRSAFTYAVFFGTAVLILSLLGFNPMPFLAGAGILGLVVGFGAQSLIHDVVSGFFILFENTYLVGDAIEAAGAKGVVEAIEFRTTKIRDSDGRLHIVRNGDVKQVINYSKEYAIAVVVVDVAYDADLPQVFAILREAGARTRRENRHVLGDIQIDGISAFGATTMTVRTSTRVEAGRHETAAAALRLAIKESFDRRSAGASRTALVPQKLGPAPHPIAPPESARPRSVRGPT
jgi:small-conductance mechanosensitive channel